MQNENDILKARYRAEDLEESRAVCAGPEELFAYVTGQVSNRLAERLETHAAQCYTCSEKIARATATLDERPRKAMPPKTLNRALMKRLKLETAGNETPSKKRLSANIALAGFVLFMIFSVVFKSFFLQMLVLAIVCACKWLMDTRRSHTHITLNHSESSKPETDLMKRVFKKSGRQ